MPIKSTLSPAVFVEISNLSAAPLPTDSHKYDSSDALPYREDEQKERRRCFGFSCHVFFNNNVSTNLEVFRGSGKR
jgi:hypothetical protein